MSFDFTSYLQNHLSAGGRVVGEPFTVQVLTGGLMNHTARVKFASPLLAIGGVKLKNGGGIHSAILKHAPPYIAVDPNQPMSVDRQLTEKKALQILSGDCFEFPHVQAVVNKYRYGRQAGTTHNSNTSIQIPKYIWHDAQHDVLWIEDLGKMKSLCQILLRDTGIQTAHIQELATVLGTFLSALFQATANPPEPWISQTTSPDSLNLYQYLTEVVLKNCRKWGSGVPESEALVLAERAGEALRAKAEAEDVCLGMVDFWPGNILVELGEFGSRCGLIDWEYFGLTSASSELGMLLAHLHVHLLNSTTTTTAQTNLQSFAKSTFLAYAHSQSHQISSNAFKRALLISHGREMINGVSYYELSEETLNEDSKTRVVAAGVRSLKAAGGSNDEIDLTRLRPSLYGDGNMDVSVIWETLGVFGFV